MDVVFFGDMFVEVVNWCVGGMCLWYEVLMFLDYWRYLVGWKCVVDEGFVVIGVDGVFVGVVWYCMFLQDVLGFGFIGVVVLELIFGVYFFWWV